MIKYGQVIGVYGNTPPSGFTLSTGDTGSISHGATIGGVIPAPCIGEGCHVYTGSPYNFFDLAVPLECCCGPDISITGYYRRDVVYSLDPTAGFAEYYGGSGPASNPFIPTTGQVIFASGDSYTINGSFGGSCIGFSLGFSDALNYFPNPEHWDHLSGAYTATCDRFTMSWTGVQDGLTSNEVIQTTYLDFQFNRDLTSCAVP